MPLAVAERTPAPVRVWPIAALATGSFAYVTAETLPVGLLPQIADGLSVPDAQVGLLMTTYAAVAALTAIPLTALSIGMRRDRLVIGCVAVFAVSQLVAAATPSFELLAAVRLVAAVAHGVFWSVIASVASRLAPPGQAARATSLVFVGNSVALVAGVPLSTALGQLAGWRAAFLVLGAAGVAATVALVRLLPELPSVADRQPMLRRTATAFGAIRDRAVATVCVITLVVVIGHFAAYTYVAPLARRAGDVEGITLTALLLAYGAAGLVGNLVAGRLADSRPRATAAGAIGLVVVALVVLALAPGGIVTAVAVTAWGAGFSAVPVCMQSAVLRVAPRVADSASAVFVVFFQLGIGGGALIGERLVASGQLGTLPPAAAVAALVALLIVIAARHAFPAHHAHHDGRKRPGTASRSSVAAKAR